MQVEEIISVVGPYASTSSALQSIGYRVHSRAQGSILRAKYYYFKDGNIFEAIKIARTPETLFITLKSIDNGN